MEQKIFIGNIRGKNGMGVPTGGNTGQILAKKTNDDNDTEWIDPTGDGDMLKSVYDPQGRKTDIFAYVDDSLAAIPVDVSLQKRLAGG